MRGKTLAMVSTALFVGTLLLRSSSLSAETGEDRVVHLAELEIDPVQLELYKAALREENRGLHSGRARRPDAVCSVCKGSPDPQIRLFEMYANAAAYEAHLQSSHFKKYKEVGTVLDRRY